ncbi:Rhodanese-like domain-containing protein [Staphylotrichum tortipilum]|uniref:Sulfurtransferase n=1 Tax=Staphylotrichum tortipilum TaxID=2831512 RepID=A0AAN6RVY5_9PEZI|nr:Rhodanese-like domain-containing protein [Staphylotrichum longicolle]
MASRRALASLAKASEAAPLPAAPRAPAAAAMVARFALRQHHTRPLVCASPLWRGTAVRTGVRAYSSDKPAEEMHKIWGFEAVQKLAKNPDSAITIIDVREPHELASTGRIPGALNIPVTSAPDSFHISADEFEDRFGFPRPAPDAEVLFYCRSGVRSRAAAGLAKAAGWTKVGEFPGSWLEWFEKGGEVER